eukprot:s1878_g18.t1
MEARVRIDGPERSLGDRSQSMFPPVLGHAQGTVLPGRGSVLAAMMLAAQADRGLEGRADSMFQRLLARGVEGRTDLRCQGLLSQSASRDTSQLAEPIGEREVKFQQANLLLREVRQQEFRAKQAIERARYIEEALQDIPLEWEDIPSGQEGFLEPESRKLGYLVWVALCGKERKGFLTAVLQGMAHLRKSSLEKMHFEHHVEHLLQNEEEVAQQLQADRALDLASFQGVFVANLVLVGASWSRRKGILEEPDPLQPSCVLPARTDLRLDFVPLEWQAWGILHVAKTLAGVAQHEKCFQSSFFVAGAVRTWTIENRVL